jgi:uncharacterized protein (DUF169 family)
MEIINEFQRMFGSRWTGVKFFFGDPPRGGKHFPVETRFCEAINQSWSSNTLLGRECTICMGCMGANYVFGWQKDIRDRVVENFHKKRNIPLKNSACIVKGLPSMESAPIAIGLNGGETPDLLVAYLQPEQFMRFLNAYQGVFGEKLKVELSGFAGVCGNVAVKAYVDKKVSLSFGCEDSRQYGGIYRDRLAVGIPYGQAQKLI